MGAAAADRADHQRASSTAGSARAWSPPVAGITIPLVVLLAPVAGGLVIGLMARYGSEKIRGHGMPEAIEAILLGGSKIAAPRGRAEAGLRRDRDRHRRPVRRGRPDHHDRRRGRVAVRAVPAADRRRTQDAAGRRRGGGMAATFNSPFAALMLAVELLLFEWRPRSYVPVAAAVVHRRRSCAVRCSEPPRCFRSPVTLHFSYGDLRAVRRVRHRVRAARCASPPPSYMRPKTGSGDCRCTGCGGRRSAGVIIGIGGLIVPQALGVGYNIIGAELDGSIGLGLVVGILIVKTVIWSLSLGSGTSGGVLAPMFMIGGALGALEAHIFPVVGPGFWALIALAGVLGGVMRSPFTGVIFAAGTHPPLRRPAAADHRRLDRVRRVRPAAQTLRADREDRPPRIPPVPRVRRRPAGDPLRRRGHGTRRTDLRIRSERRRSSGGDLGHRPGGCRLPATDALPDRRRRTTTCKGSLPAPSLRPPSTTDAATIWSASSPYSEPVVTHPDETLRAVATTMAATQIDRMPVVAREDQPRSSE